jgi:hypothetical protein
MGKPKPNATAIARAAGCSRQLAARLLARGMTKAEIIERMERRREAEAARSAVNGHAAGFGTVAPFAESQARKERALAQLREIEVAVRIGELVPAGQIGPFLDRCLSVSRDELLRIPGELADRLAQEVSPAVIRDLLADRLKSALRHIHDAKEIWEAPLLPTA